jgi:hypothetical protein
MMALVVAGQEKTQARRVQRLAAARQLRRIYAGIYTDDLTQPLGPLFVASFSRCARWSPLEASSRIVLLWRADAPLPVKHVYGLDESQLRFVETA